MANGQPNHMTINSIRLRNCTINLDNEGSTQLGGAYLCVYFVKACLTFVDASLSYTTKT